MIKKIKTFILSLSSLLILLAPMAVATSTTYAVTTNIQGSLCSGTQGNLSGTNNTCYTTGGTNTFQDYVRFALNFLSIIVGIAAVIMIIVAGLRYVTSGGKDEAVKGAKNTILYAVIGLIIVALAQVIVHFVLTQSKAPGTS